jgi:TolB-like protein/DNA-binding SARP family transcriptional activator/Tfp pilus assembly protein PilF
MSKRLKLFGCAVVETPAGPLEGRAAQRHRVALLAVLASTRRPARSRDSLIAMLWPEADSERGRRMLSDSVYRINQAMGGDVVVASGDDLRLNRTLLPSDVDDFETALLAKNHESLATAYAGAFLDGFHLPGSAEFEQWLQDERTRYEGEAVRALESLAEAAESREQWADSVGWWRRAAALAPDSSRIALRLMRALDRSGDRGAAIRHATIHSTLVRESLGIEPDAAIEHFAESLRDPPRQDTRTVVPDKRAPASADPEPRVVSENDPNDAGLPLSRERRVLSRERRMSSELRRQPWLVVAGMAVLAIAAIFLFDRTRDSRVAEAAPAAIAVLPFRNISSSESTAYFAEGMTDELMYMIGRDTKLRVLARTSAFAYRDSLLDIRELGRRLGVAWVVDGSVRRGGAALRITARLTSTIDGYQVWSETFDRQASDVIAIQEEIAAAIARRVGSGAGRAGEADTGRQRGEVGDAEAYDLYLRGRYHWHRRTEGDLRQAISLLEQSVKRAPDYARGWAGLGDAYAVSGFYDYLKPAEAFPRAEDAARRALSLDARLAAPHATIGYLNLYYRWNWAVADSAFRQAIAIEPTYSTAHQWLGNLLTAMGRFDEAEAEMRIAQQLDPLSLIANAALGWVYFHAGRFDDAVAQCQRTIALDPNFQLAHMWMAQAETQRGKHVEALRAARESVRLTNGSTLPLTVLAYVQARGGARDSASAIIGRLFDRERRGEYAPSYELAIVHLALGDTNAALARLEHAFDERSHSMAFLRVDPQLEGLKAEPRYRTLVRKVGLEPPGT